LNAKPQIEILIVIMFSCLKNISLPFIYNCKIGKCKGTGKIFFDHKIFKKSISSPRISNKLFQRIYQTGIYRDFPSERCKNTKPASQIDMLEIFGGGDIWKKSLLI